MTAATIAELRKGVLRVRQRPGPNNALGLIKFVVQNPEGVYLHGAPAQALFARSRRDFSHGCVRVADPVALAEWVLRDRPEWDRERIVAATSGSQTLQVPLARPTRVIFFYTTAVVTPGDGLIRFAEDIYRHDESARAGARGAENATSVGRVRYRRARSRRPGRSRRRRCARRAPPHAAWRAARRRGLGPRRLVHGPYGNPDVDDAGFEPRVLGNETQRADL